MNAFQALVALTSTLAFVTANDGALRLRTNDHHVTLNHKNHHDNSAESIEDMFWGERELEMSMSLSMSGSIPPCVQSAERTMGIIEYISTISTSTDLETEGSPQQRALEFVLEEGPPGIVCLNDPTCGNDRVKNRYLMALLYYSTEGDDWTNCSEFGPCDQDKCNLGSEPWLSSKSECDWCGLSCDNVENLPPVTDGCETTDIDIEKINQSGVLPFELGFDQDMRQIFMEDGTIGGVMPEFWSNMRFLAVLDLNDQALGGSIPDSYYTLLGLNVLDLDNNNLIGGVSEAIGNLQNLQFFEVGDNQMGGPFPQALGSLQNLGLLAMQNNDFTGLLPTEFGDSLVNITVQNNRLSGPITFLSDDDIIPNIEIVDLSENDFAGEIPDALESAIKLRFFNISVNSFDGEEMPPDMEDLLAPDGALEALSSDCLPVDDPPVLCPFCTFCTENN